MSTEIQSSVFTRENAENILKPYIAIFPDIDVMKLFEDFTDQFEYTISFLKACVYDSYDLFDDHSCSYSFKRTVPIDKYELYILFTILFQRLHQHQLTTYKFQIESDGISIATKSNDKEKYDIPHKIMISIIQKQAICIDFSSEELRCSHPVSVYNKDDIDALKNVHAFTMYTEFSDKYISEVREIYASLLEEIMASQTDCELPTSTGESCSSESSIEYRDAEPIPSNKKYGEHMSSLTWNYTVPRKHFDLYQVFAGFTQYRMETKFIINIICADE